LMKKSSRIGTIKAHLNRVHSMYIQIWGMVQKGGKKGNNLKELGKRLPPSHRGHFFNLKISSNIKKKLSRFFKRDKT
jgi:hypothetical protein